MTTGNKVVGMVVLIFTVAFLWGKIVDHSWRSKQKDVEACSFAQGMRAAQNVTYIDDNGVDRKLAPFIKLRGDQEACDRIGQTL